MKTIFKLLSAVALVGAVGGALANQGQQNPCTTDGTQGYVKTSPSAPDPMLPPGEDPNVQSAGRLNENFLCEESSNQCFWAYAPGNPNANPEGWIQCTGTFELIQN